jgi:3'(2'), 5'-bisphosphate nucleotidase
MSANLLAKEASSVEAFLLSDAEIQGVLQAVYDAGAAILEVYGRADFSVEHKADDSPLTAADRAAHEVLDAALRATPFPILSEEGRSIPYSERSQWSALWVVDPLDGTKEFIKRNGEFTVNVALVHQGIPVFGIVFAPVLGWVFLGHSTLGAFYAESALTWSELRARPAVRVADQENYTKPLPGSPLRVVASRSHNSPETEALLAHWEEKFGPVERVSMGSSLKLCWVALGKAEAYPRLAPTMEWDTAAGQAFAESAGCSVRVVKRAEDGTFSWEERLRYNRPDLLNPWFLVCGAPYLCADV